MSRISQRVFVCLCVAVAAHILILYLLVLSRSVTHPAIRSIQQITISFDEAKPPPQKKPVNHQRRFVKKNTVPVQPSAIKIKPKKIVRRQVKLRVHHRQMVIKKSTISRERHLSKFMKVSTSANNTPVAVKDGLQNVEERSVATTVINAAKPLYQVNPIPRYPRIARQRGLEGTVIIEVMVDIRGRVLKAVVFETSGYSILDHAALKAVKNWTFSPGSVNGKKEAMEVKVPIKFQLND